MRFVLIFWAGLMVSLSAEAKTFNIVLANIPPYAMQTKDGASGILVDLTRETLKRMGHEAYFQFVPWPRAIQYIKNGRADAIAPFFKDPSREDYAYFPKKGLVEMELSFFRKKNTAIEVKSLDDVLGYRLVKVNKANLGPKFSRMVNEGLMKLEVVQNTELGLNVLLAGRAELLASVKMIAQYVAKNTKKADQIEEAGPAFDRLDAYLAFSKQTTDEILVDQFYKAFSKLKKSAYYQQVLSKYLD